MIIEEYYLSRVMRKPAICKCENKDADQLRSNCAADQRLCFRYTDSTIPLLPTPENSSLWPSCVAVQPGLCRTWLETPKTGFLTTRLICCCFINNTSCGNSLELPCQYTSNEFPQQIFLWRNLAKLSVYYCKISTLV